MLQYIKNKLFLKKTDYLLLLLWILAFIIIYPIGEFPINDDWAYSKNVYNLSVNHVFIVDQFPAMNLISQTIYGTLFSSIFGFSFFTLRLSILLLSSCASVAFKEIIFQLSGKNEWFSFFVSVLLFFNPLFLSLSFTFMTDLFFGSMLIFAFLAFYKYLQSNSLKFYTLYLLFTIIAVLNRQHGLLLSILPLSLIVREIKNIKLYILMLAPPVLTWLAHDKYRHYLTKNGILHGIQYSSDLLEYLKTAPLNNHLLKAGDSLLVIGSILFPLVLSLIFSTKTLFDKKRYWLAFLLIIPIIIYLVSFDVKFYPLGNISYLLEVGPKAVKNNSSKEYFGLIELYRILLVVCSSLTLIFGFAFIISKQSALYLKNKFLYYILICISLILFLFISISKAYFDRYSIPTIIFLCITLIPYYIKANKIIIVIVSIYLLGMYLISVLEIKDYFNWQTARWTALETLNSKGISAKKIDGGFEYNGWFKPNKNYSDVNKSWWWVDDDTYVVTNTKLANYSVDTIYSYQKYIPFTKDTIFVLKRLP